MFEPGARHSFSLALGRNIANPTAILLATAHLLRHINLPEHANKLETALLSVIQTGRILTEDVGGRSTTTDFVNAVSEVLQP
ncbi:unnamed protein product [Protopolystoma xenopodis]|uniref:Isopropylmalate dehydrogenase-like domain-containing protein n=1 Tax=Protopolystoma xenopodis TaxID=117903 RepID=A0A448XM29_9PLAT|nr:unnamed protein product [Protopolystoma xenopodis]